MQWQGQMNKSIICILLTIFSTGVMAEWVLVGKSNTGNAYVDLATIRKAGNKITIWSLDDHPAIQQIPSAGKYLSARIQYDFDCENKTKKVIALVLYSANMGGGKVVFNARDSSRKYEPVSSGSIDEGRLKLVCSKQN
jgi:hypothetical protein